MNFRANWLVRMARADVIISWNFQHMVNLKKIIAYNKVNKRHGYLAIEIRSPLEVLDYEED